METDNTRIPLGSYVELKEGREDVYQFAQAGSRGWIRDTRIDSLGFPMVYIEWDKDHWRYNGEKDGWTFQDHWNVLETPDPTNFVQRFINQIKQEELCPNCGEKHGGLDEQAKFIDTLMEGVEEALGSDAFFLITLKPQVDEKHPEVQLYVPEIFSASLTEFAAKMIEAQIVHLASIAHREATIERLNDLTNKDKE